MVGAGFQYFISLFQNYGLMDFLLPFILVFTIMFAVLKKVHLFKENKNFQVVISLVVALLFVVPHFTGAYGNLGYDPVQVLNESLPSVALMAVAVVMILILLGLVGGAGDSVQNSLAVLMVLGVAYVFGSSLNLWRGPWDIFYWWTSDITELMLIIFVFGLIVWFITKEESGNNKPNKALEGLKDFFKGFRNN